MHKLYVCGDSFASLIQDQIPGTSWSEILSSRLNSELINFARPGASNISIAIQIDHALNIITPADYLIVFLTDHTRLTQLIPYSRVNVNKSLYDNHDTHRNQRNKNLSPSITTGTINNPSNDAMLTSFNTAFDVNFQYFIDHHVILGMLHRLKPIPHLVVSSGWGRNILAKNTYPLPKGEINLMQIDLTYLISLGHSSERLNHLSDLGHMKLANLVHANMTVA